MRHTVPAGVDPENVLEAEVLPEDGVDNLDGDSHVLPALLADIGSTRS